MRGRSSSPRPWIPPGPSPSSPVSRSPIPHNLNPRAEMLKEYQVVASEWEAQTRDLKRQLAEARGRRDAADELNVELRSNIEELRNQLALQQMREGTVIERMQRLERNTMGDDRNHVSQAELAALRQENNLLRRRIKEEENSRIRMQSEMGRDMLSYEKDMLAKVNHEAAILELKQENNALRREKNERDQADRGTAKYKSQAAELQHEVKLLSRRLAEAHESQDLGGMEKSELLALRQENSNLRRKLSSADSTYESDLLRQEVTTLKRQLKDEEAARRKIEGDSRLVLLQNERELLTKFEQSEAIVTGLRETLQARERQVEETNQKLRAKEMMLDTLRTELADLKGKSGAEETALSIMKNKYNNINSGRDTELNSASAKARAAESQLAGLRAEVSNLKQQLDTETAANTGLRRECMSLTKQRDDEYATSKQLRDERTDLIHQRDLEAREKTRVRDEYDAAVVEHMQRLELQSTAIKEATLAIKRKDEEIDQLQTESGAVLIVEQKKTCELRDQYAEEKDKLNAQLQTGNEYVEGLMVQLQEKEQMVMAQRSHLLKVFGGKFMNLSQQGSVVNAFHWWQQQTTRRIMGWAGKLFMHNSLSKRTRQLHLILSLYVQRWRILATKAACSRGETKTPKPKRGLRRRSSTEQAQYYRSKMGVH